MSGVDSIEGVELAEMAHIQQSLRDIIRTLIGERVMRREYGSWVRALVDAPADPVTVMDIYASVIGAIKRWEPRVFVERVEAPEVLESGRVVLTVRCRHRRTGEPITLSNIEF